MAAGSVGRRNLGGCMENPRNLWIHIDELVSFDGDPLVSIVYLLFYPVSEWITYDAVGYVADVGPF